MLPVLQNFSELPWSPWRSRVFWPTRVFSQSYWMQQMGWVQRAARVRGTAETRADLFCTISPHQRYQISWGWKARWEGKGRASQLAEHRGHSLPHRQPLKGLPTVLPWLQLMHQIPAESAPKSHMEPNSNHCNPSMRCPPQRVQDWKKCVSCERMPLSSMLQISMHGLS